MATLALTTPSCANLLALPRNGTSLHPSDRFSTSAALPCHPRTLRLQGRAKRLVRLLPPPSAVLNRAFLLHRDPISVPAQVSVSALPTSHCVHNGQRTLHVVIVTRQAEHVAYVLVHRRYLGAQVVGRRSMAFVDPRSVPVEVSKQYARDRIAGLVRRLPVWEGAVSSATKRGFPCVENPGLVAPPTFYGQE